MMDSTNAMRRDESRRGTHECVRHKELFSHEYVKCR